jgi:lambda repressor-like predicted transcriptional regulator
MKVLSLKEKAIYYRERGYSYSMISKRIGLAKSTLSSWLKDVPYKPNKIVLKRIQWAPSKSAEKSHKKKVLNIITERNIAKKELGKISKRDLWLLGIGLYLGEGSKLDERIRIINSDPKIIKLSVKWLKDICGLKKENIVPYVHLYPDNNIANTVKYWSKITDIPQKQFGKTQIDNRKNKSNKKRRKLPYGTLHLQVKSCGNKDFGVKLHRKIMGWIEAVYDQI